MAVDKLVDSTQLNNDLTSVANAIRTRGGTSAQLAFPNGFVSAVGAIGNQYSAADEGKVVSSGALVSQTSDTVTTNDTYDTTLINSLTVNVSGGGGTQELYYNNVTSVGSTLYAEETIAPAETPATFMRRLKGASALKKFTCLRTSDYGGSNTNNIASAFEGCSNLEEVTLMNGVSTSGYCEDIIKSCPNIKSFTTGGIGYPNTVGMGSPSGSYMMFRNVTVAFDIIIYTTATSIATVPSNIKTGSPWGATNATVIYKNSTTGAVLT